MSTRPLRSRVVLGVIATVIVGGLAALAILILSTTGEVVDTAKRFMEAVESGRTDEAWSLCAPAFQERLKTPAALAAATQRSGARLAGWSFGRKRVAEFYATIPLKLEWSDGTKTNGGLHLAQIDGRWGVTGIEAERAK